MPLHLALDKSQPTACPYAMSSCQVRLSYCHSMWRCSVHQSSSCVREIYRYDELCAVCSITLDWELDTVGSGCRLSGKDHGQDRLYMWCRANDKS